MCQLEQARFRVSCNQWLSIWHSKSFPGTASQEYDGILLTCLVTCCFKNTIQPSGTHPGQSISLDRHSIHHFKHSFPTSLAVVCAIQNKNTAITHLDIGLQHQISSPHLPGQGRRMHKYTNIHRFLTKSRTIMTCNHVIIFLHHSLET